MNANQVVTLIQHYLKEQGFQLALAALQEESQIDFVEHAVPSGELVSILTQFTEARDSAQRVHVSQRTREQRRDDEELQVAGDGRVPNALERTITDTHTGNILTVRASQTEDVLVSGGTDRTVRVTDVATGRVLRTFTHHKAGVLGADVHPTNANLLLTCSMDSTHQMLDLSKPDDSVVVQSWKDHSKYVTRARWSPDGEYFVTCSYDHTACLYKRTDATYSLLKRFTMHGTVEAAAFSPDGQYLVLGARDDNYLHSIKIADLSVQQHNMNANKDDFISFTPMELAFSPDGKYLLLATDKSRLILFRANSDDQVLNFYGIENNEYSQPRLAWHPSGKYFYVTSQERRICVFEVANRSIVYTLEGHTGTVRDLVYDVKRDCLWSCAYDSTIRQWTLDESQAI